MLNYHEYFSRVKIPESLKDKIFEINPENLNTKKKIEYLENTSKVNIFVGPNNSGKSRFLRSILKELNIQSFEIAEIYLNQLLTNLDAHKEKLTNPFKSVTRNDFGNDFYPITKLNGVGIDFSEYYNSLIEYIKNHQIDKLCEQIYGPNSLILQTQSSETLFSVNFYDDHLHQYRSGDVPSPSNIINYFKNAGSDLFSLIDKLKPNFKTPQKIYVPNVRTLKNYSDDKGYEVYATQQVNTITQHTREKYFKGYKEIEILDGQDLYLILFNKRNNSNTDLERVKDFQNFLSKLFFQGRNVDLITDVKNHQIKIKIGNEQERLIHDVGDGVQQTIMLTYPLFFNDCGIMVIEEPEMWLHPGLQKTLMEIFLSEDLAIEYKYSKNFIFFIATHSNHILDIQKNKELISIYTVEKESDKENPDLIINNIANQDMRILDLIGVSNSSVYLANCAIWVEGSTDKLYLGKYLEETIKHFKDRRHKDENPTLNITLNSSKLNEGINYTFAFSAGNSIFNLDFTDDEVYDGNEKDIIIRFLTNKALVITDNDQNKNKELKKKLKDNLGDKYIELGVNEIENLLDLSVIAESVRKTWNNSQSDSTEILSKLSSNQQFNTLEKKLGSFLDQKLKNYLDVYGFKVLSFKKESGTIKEKTKFCNNAIGLITYENMSDEAKEVALKILDFILKSNNLN